jgi:hypothetical protein
LWYAKCYREVHEDEPKGTETYKKSQVILLNAEEYKKRQKRLNVLYYVKDKLKVLINSYEMQSRTLQTIASSLRKEMEIM